MFIPQGMIASRLQKMPGPAVLIGYVLDVLARNGLRLAEVKTLDRSAGYEPYESTNAFWQRVGFVQIDTIDPYPAWQPGNPAAIYVAALTSTRVAPS